MFENSIYYCYITGTLWTSKITSLITSHAKETRTNVIVWTVFPIPRSDSLRRKRQWIRTSVYWKKEKKLTDLIVCHFNLADSCMDLTIDCIMWACTGRCSEDQIKKECPHSCKTCNTSKIDIRSSYRQQTFPHTEHSAWLLSLNTSPNFAPFTTNVDNAISQPSTNEKHCATPWETSLRSIMFGFGSELVLYYKPRGWKKRTWNRFKKSILICPITYSVQ